MTAGAAPAGRADERAAAEEVVRLLGLGLDEPALELTALAAQHHARFTAAAVVAERLRRIHFAEGEEETSTSGDPTLDALRLSARLRPHGRGALGVWERTLLRSLLP
jgi:hypothetical protein